MVEGSLSTSRHHLVVCNFLAQVVQVGAKLLALKLLANPIAGLMHRLWRHSSNFSTGNVLAQGLLFGTVAPRLLGGHLEIFGDDVDRFEQVWVTFQTS